MTKPPGRRHLGMMWADVLRRFRDHLHTTAKDTDKNTDKNTDEDTDEDTDGRTP